MGAMKRPYSAMADSLLPPSDAGTMLHHDFGRTSYKHARARAADCRQPSENDGTKSKLFPCVGLSGWMRGSGSHLPAPFARRGRVRAPNLSASYAAPDATRPRALVGNANPCQGRSSRRRTESCRYWRPAASIPRASLQRRDARVLSRYQDRSILSTLRGVEGSASPTSDIPECPSRPKYEYEGRILAATPDPLRRYTAEPPN